MQPSDRRDRLQTATPRLTAKGGVVAGVNVGRAHADASGHASEADPSAGRPWRPGRPHPVFHNHFLHVLVLSAFLTSVFPPLSFGGDILRGGATASGAGRKNAEARQSSGADAAALAKIKAADRLARTTKAVNDMRQLQESARAAASGGGVPDGLTTGGLERLPGGTWTGADAPVQSGNNVNIRQTVSQALLDWKTFNVGKNTTVNFDQKAGGTDSGKWIAFNKVFDPSGKPSQIRGKINADGQVYIINQNGIIFGAGSQVNARTLVASSLPINDNLIEQGLLNNRDAQFLFSALPVSGGTDGTPAFNPPAPPPSGRYGDVVVETGALIQTTTSQDGNGGRVMLAGANVNNQGVIETPAGQTILAAGLQVGIAAHDSSDPSLRGLDVWVGAVGDYAGNVTNTGLVDSQTGSIVATGRIIQQYGILESSTSVDLNGRIDLNASFGAVGNPGFDNVGGGGVGGPIFVNQFTGLVEFGPRSTTRILPDYASSKSIPGTALPELSRVNITGQIVNFRQDAILLAPSALVSANAGIWPYKDTDGTRTTNDATGNVETGLISYFAGSAQRFLHSGGWINLESGSLIDVSGTTNVFVPLSQSILTVEFRGAELADTPLQRRGMLRGVPLVVDIRKTGTVGGRFWMGTPLGDVTGQANLIERNVSQLTVNGGSVNLQAGGAITVGDGATIDVSGGYFNYEGGRVQTTRLRYKGNVFDIAAADPEISYEGIYTGQSTSSSQRWGVTRTYAAPLAPTGTSVQPSYVAGANGGSLTLQAAAIAVNGTLRGEAITSDHQRKDPPTGASLSLVFESEYQRTVTATDIRFLRESPVAPDVAFTHSQQQAAAGALMGGDPSTLPFETLAREDYLAAVRRQSGFRNVSLSPSILTESGFSDISVSNLDGNITVRSDGALDAGPRGSVVLEAANVAVFDNVVSSGGTLSFTAHTISPYLSQTFDLDNPAGAPTPLADPSRGLFTLASGTSLNASGLVLDDRPTNPRAMTQPIVTEGGTVTIDAYSADLRSGSIVDVSGGGVVSPLGKFTYGDAGSITIRTGRDQTFRATTGGSLTLKSTLRGFSGATGGSLSIQALLIHIGHGSIYPNSLVLAPEFFQQGGFTSYTITGIGTALNNPRTDPDAPDPYAPAVTIEDGVTIEPLAVGLLARPTGGQNGGLVLEEMTYPLGLRTPVDLNFEAIGADDEFTVAALEARGDIVAGAGSRIIGEPGASFSFRGDTVTLLGEISAPGGSISIAGSDVFPVPVSQKPTVAFATPTVYIGPNARISAVGAAVYQPDPFGRRIGTLLDGGTITISGNILAEAGARLDVSGSSAEFDIHPTYLGVAGTSVVPPTSGLTQPPWTLRHTPVTLDSSGGTIELTGSEMLLTDADLVGRSGGPTAQGGTLKIFSGRFYSQASPARTGADINLIVRPAGNVLPDGRSTYGIGRPVYGSDGRPITGMGYFAVDRFSSGDFDSLDLGANYLTNASPIPYGGNVRFEGDVTISARGSLRVAQGGIIEALGRVALKAPYVAIGQPFRAPLHPDDNVILFYQSPASPTNVYNFAPTYGSGSLNVSASLIDVGSVSFEKLGQVTLSAPGGDIRGNGTVQLAGDLTLQAAQIYPATLSAFDVFAYDHGSVKGSVTILGSGTAPAPLSAGGSIGIFASTILQSGFLRAPLGQIVLGWDGTTDLDQSDGAITGPLNPIADSTKPAPLASTVSLSDGSVTSVSGLDWSSGNELLIPYGLSPDGLAWIDPSGVNITTMGLPEKRVSILGDRVTMSSASTIDIRGGGDLYAFRWIPGQGGSVDLTGGTPNAWTSGTTYTAGDRVAYRGQTWSARVGNSGETPAAGQFWSQVPQSYAILPGSGLGFAPYAPFNSSPNASALGGDAGYVDSSLRIGAQVRLDGIPGLSAGTYTLLPSRYALLPGAFLVTPTSSAPIGTVQAPDGSYFANGTMVDSLNTSQRVSPVLTRYKVSSYDVVRDNAEYNDFTFNTFATEAAARLQVDTVQRLPMDAGGAVFQGTSGFSLEGRVLGTPANGGRGGFVDIATTAPIQILGGGAIAPPGATAVLRTETLNAWNVESLLIGGLRRTGQDSTLITVRTSNIVVNTPGATLAAPDVTLASKESLTVFSGSSVQSTGPMTAPAERFTIVGDGTALRVSGDDSASLTRSGLTGSTLPNMTIGSGVKLLGSGVILDSTYATSLDPDVDIQATALTLGSGQLSIVLPGFSGPLSGSLISPHLVLSGAILNGVQLVNSLTLRSYRTVDIYGSGNFGSATLGNLTFEAAGLRGYGQGGFGTTMSAANILFTNESAAAFTAPPATSSGMLVFNSLVSSFGSNDFRISGYSAVSITAMGGVQGTSSGSFTSDGSLTINTPRITGTRGSTTTVTTGSSLTLNRSAGEPVLAAGLGAGFTFGGSSVTSQTDILLPSGVLALQAETGDVTISGSVDVSGGSQTFFDVIRYADAGNIFIQSKAGSVRVLPGSFVSVAAAAAGGDAGTLEIRSPNGSFVEGGMLSGAAGAGGEAGSFVLDTGTLASYSTIRDTLSGGGFFKSQAFRLQNGDVVLDGISRAADFAFSTDRGSISVTGTIDASGTTGGTIALSARDNVTVQSGALLTAAGQRFNSAGKGGVINLEAGSDVDGIVNTAARVQIQAGSAIDLSVAEFSNFVPGDYTTPYSAAFFGNFTGTLHVRGPRLAGNDVGVDSIQGSVMGASSILVEGFQLYDLTGSGTMNRSLRDSINAANAAYITGGEAAMRTKLLAGNPAAATLDPLLVIAPGVEIINRTGNLTLGLANPTGSTNSEALSAADWDLSTWRYGSRGAPGVLTLRAQGDLVFNNALSDGFTPVSATSANGNSTMWLARPQTINDNLPTNVQSWSYRLTAGADLASSDVTSVLPLDTLNLLQPGRGSVLVGEFYPAVPNSNTAGVSPAVGLTGLTSSSIRISTTTADQGTRYEIIRTGTGSIDVSAGRDVQLRNQFATIYTAGVAVPSPRNVFSVNDFVIPVVPTLSARHPSQGNLGAVQQLYQPAWTLAGGNVAIQAGSDIGRFTRLTSGEIVADSSRQLPNNWLYRRSYVDPATGLFANDGGLDGTALQRITDVATSTTWWIDFSNFFEGIGALGGGDIDLVAGNDIINADAVIPTNARMPGRDISTGVNLAPDASKLVEWGGGDLTVSSGHDVSGGVYYVQRGTGEITAGGAITTNSSRSPSLGILGSTSLSLDLVESQTPAVFDQRTWLPTMLFAGNSRFNIKARNDILLGPTLDTFLLPQGLNNRFWYKTYFSTETGSSGTTVSSFGGGITHRYEAILPGSASPIPILQAWMDRQNVYAGTASSGNSSYYQPWIRLAEQDVSFFNKVASVNAPTLLSTAFAGSINVVGSGSFFPSSTGTIELLASDGITGLNSTGRSVINGANVTAWTYSALNVSDADPASLPGITTPIAYQAFTGRDLGSAQLSNINALSDVNSIFQETGSITGTARSIESQRLLHASTLLHKGDMSPVRLYAGGGDLTGITLFSPKFARIFSDRDLTDVAFYLQNTDVADISVVSAGRDIIPFNENSAVRSIATDTTLRNVLQSVVQTTVAGTTTTALAGDIQISGPGLLEVLAGRNLDLGTGANFTAGTGVGITSVANARNPFLPSTGANLIALTGVGGAQGGGPALGLSQSSLEFEGFIQLFSNAIKAYPALYLSDLEGGANFASLSEEQKAVVALEYFYELLREAGVSAAAGGTYDRGYEAIDSLLQSAAPFGELLTRSRDIRTVSGGSITLAALGGGLTLASDIIGNPQTPPGIVTEFGGRVDIFTKGNVDIGQARIFTLRGGDLTIWSSEGDIAAGNAPKTVVTAPPTRVVIDSNSAALQTDLGGLATGGGIGVLASVEGVEPGNISLIAPKGVVDAGDAGIRATGNITIAAVAVLNAENISAAGTSVGVPTAPTVAAPNIAGLTSGNSATAATSSAADSVANQANQQPQETIETPSIISVEVLGYGGGDSDEG